jgi:hypothetical protein
VSGCTRSAVQDVINRRTVRMDRNLDIKLPPFGFQLAYIYTSVIKIW